MVFVKLCVLMAVVLLGATFALYNNQPISLSFVVIETFTASLGLWLLIFLFTGVLLGMAASVLVLYQTRRLLESAKKSLDAVNKLTTPHQCVTAGQIDKPLLD